MIPASHPVVQALAEEIAREALAVVLGNDGTGTLWDDLTSRSQARVIDHHAALLVDVRRRASRDAWVQWLAVNWVVSPSTLRHDPANLAATVRAALETM